MEIYLIKEKEKPGKLIQDYFFNITDKCAYSNKMTYFIDNSILSSEYNHNYYYNLPFKIFTILYSSTLQPITKLNNTISIPQNIWNEKYFAQAKIDSVNQKKEILSLLIDKIDKFLIQFQEDKKLTLENIEWLREGMESDAINQKLELYSNNYLYLSSMSEFIQLNEDFEFKDNPSYYELYVEFIKKSLEMYQALTAADLLQYDFFESDNEVDKIKMISHHRIHITKFYAQTILKFILDDIVKVINCYFEQSSE